MIKQIMIVTLVAVLSGCGSALQVLDSAGNDLMSAPHVYTQVNLHPDPINRRLYATNYQMLGFIPRCTEVDLRSVSKKALVFIDKTANLKYDYFNHRSAAEPFESHLQHFFATSCDKNAVNRLSKIDQKGIDSGKALIGMSKQGVVYAMGIPPKHVTPSLDMDVWTYWKSRFMRRLITFDNKGKVSNIQG